MDSEQLDLLDKVTIFGDNNVGVVVAFNTFDKKRRWGYYEVMVVFPKHSEYTYRTVLTEEDIIRYAITEGVTDFGKYLGMFFRWVDSLNVTLVEKFNQNFCGNCGGLINNEKEMCWACEHGV